MRRLPFIVAMTTCACTAPLVADAAKPPPQTSLTIAAKPAAVTYGGAVAISGSRRGANHSNRPVALQANPYPFRGFKDVAHTTTNSKGAYRFTIKPIRHTRYRTV